MSPAFAEYLVFIFQCETEALLYPHELAIFQVVPFYIHPFVRPILSLHLFLCIKIK